MPTISATELSGWASTPPRRWRRKSGRTEFVAIRTFPEIKDLITQIADEQEKHLGEVVEDAVRLLYRSLKDKVT
jgi:hypothetical protein